MMRLACGNYNHDSAVRTISPDAKPPGLPHIKSFTWNVPQLPFHAFDLSLIDARLCPLPRAAFLFANNKIERRMRRGRAKTDRILTGAVHR